MSTQQPATQGYAAAYCQPSDDVLELVEYGDYTNARCQVLQKVIGSTWPGFGEDIRHTFRHFPNLANPQALFMALAAEAARRQGQFWPMHRALFAQGTTRSVDTVTILAVMVDLELDRFLDDLHDATLKEDVLAGVEAGRMAGVTTAPTVFIGAHRVVGKLTQARIGPLIHHYLRHPSTQVFSTVDQVDGSINWSNTGCHL